MYLRRIRPCSNSSPLLIITVLPLPLPLNQHGQEVPETKLRPQTVQEDQLRVFSTLPEHEITQTLHTASTNQQIQRWIPRGKEVRLYLRRGDALGVGIGRLVGRIRTPCRVWVECCACGDGVVDVNVGSVWVLGRFRAELGRCG